MKYLLLYWIQTNYYSLGEFAPPKPPEGGFGNLLVNRINSKKEY
jgi:hypothetical protein